MKSHLSDVIEVFMEAEYEVTVFATRREHEATELVEELAAGYDRLICSGGDGTLHEVMEGLMHLPKEKRCPCGYIPAGTVNDFAHTMALPAKLEDIAKVAVSGQLTEYDVGSMNGAFFNYIAAFGAFTSVAYETPQTYKNIMGRAAYLLEGIVQLPTIHPYHMVIRGDNGLEFEDDFVFGMITNAKSVGGFPVFRKTPLRLDDGVFEGIFVKNPKNPMELQSVITAFLSASSNDQIVAFRSSKFEIICEDTVSYTLDGEDGGNYNRVQIENHKEAITYVRAKDKKRKGIK